MQNLSLAGASSSGCRFFVACRTKTTGYVPYRRACTEIRQDEFCTYSAIRTPVSDGVGLIPGEMSDSSLAGLDGGAWAGRDVHFFGREYHGRPDEDNTLPRAGARVCDNGHELTIAILDHRISLAAIYSANAASAMPDRAMRVRAPARLR